MAASARPAPCPASPAAGRAVNADETGEVSGWTTSATATAISSAPARPGSSNRAGPPRRRAAARQDASGLDIGWVLAWYRLRPAVRRYLTETGFRFSYRADGVSVYRPAAAARAAAP